MAFLIVAGITVSVASKSKDIVDNLDDARAFDNTARASYSPTRKNNYQVTTTLMTRASADTLIAAMPAATAVTCSGDMLATGSYFARVTGESAVMVPGVENVAVSFTLLAV